MTCQLPAAISGPGGLHVMIPVMRDTWSGLHAFSSCALQVLEVRRQHLCRVCALRRQNCNLQGKPTALLPQHISRTTLVGHSSHDHLANCHRSNMAALVRHAWQVVCRMSSAATAAAAAAAKYCTLRTCVSHSQMHSLFCQPTGSPAVAWPHSV
jgi:hypothetical protein